MENSKTKVVLFLGAGFSAESGFPKTSELNEKLLKSPIGGQESELEEFISAAISRFWETVFGWKEGMKKPSLEDHFTQIDMAISADHSLGSSYDSARLRAIRQLTMHRIFGHLTRPEDSPPPDCVAELLGRLAKAFELAIVTTNWDNHVEWILDEQSTDFNCGVDLITPGGKAFEREGRYQS